MRRCYLLGLAEFQKNQHILKCFEGDFKYTEDFPHKIKYRLINPFRSDIGKITMIVADKINKIHRSVC